MNTSLAILSGYLIPLAIMQIIIFFRKKLLNNDEIKLLDEVSCIPIMNMVYIAVLVGYTINNLLNKMDKK